MVRVLTGLLASAAVAASPAAPGLVVSGPTPLVAERAAPAVDLAAIRERTRAYEAAKAPHRAQTARLSFTDEVGPLLQAAQSKTGAPPSSLGRLSFPPGVSAARRAELDAAQGELEQAVALLELGRAKALAHLSAVEAALPESPHQAVLLARLTEQRRQLEERYTEAADLASGASADLLNGDGLGERVLRYGLQLSSKDAATSLSRLRVRLEEWGAVRASPILGAELTYVNGPLTPLALPTAQVTPAYLSGGASGLALEDTTQGREVELSPEVLAKAQSLATAKAAYDFVRNESKLDWYYGSLKGSTETLRELRGNDADLSALLIALLRAQGRPARYVRGTIELPVARLSELMGLLDAAQADALYARGPGATPFSLPAATRDRALQALSAAGVPYQPVQSGGQVTAVQLSHVWVEAYLPYADYRGVGEGTEGRQWVPLEPAIPGSAKYAATPPVLDALLEMQATPASLTDAYLAGTRGATSALDFYRSRVTAFLAQSRPGVFYPQTLRQVQQREEPLSLIPGTLPYKVVSVHEEAAFLPDAAKHRMRVTAKDGAGAFLTVTVPLHQVVGHRAIFGCKPSTPADEEAVQLAGGLYNAPASIVEVLAVVRVDGRELAVATRAVGLGAEHDLSVELLLPDGSSRRLDNRLIAGNFVALGFGGPANGFVEAEQDDAADLDGPAPRFLYARAAAYANAWTDAGEELAQLLQVVPVRPTANVAFVQNQLAVDQALGIRKQVVWKGLEVDADLRTMVPLELVPGRAAALLRLSGHEGSYQEAKTLSEGSGEEAVSAVGVLQEANSRGAQVLLITQANAATQLPLLSASSEVLRDVADQVARGREVLIPSAPLAIRDWTGTGFIARDPQTEEAGYFLSGRLSGGQTVVSPGLWADQAMVESFKLPDAPNAEQDVALAAQILKVRQSDLQQVRVGSVARPLKVLVLTADGRPVSGAGVTFFRAGASKPGLAQYQGTLDSVLGATDVPGGVHSLPDSVGVVTNEYGVATVQTTPDPVIAEEAIFDMATPNPQFNGFNRISARAQVSPTITLQLQQPFFLIGKPEAPAKVTLGARTAFVDMPVALDLGQQLPATVTDKFGNLLANQSLAWTGSPDTGRFVDSEKVSSPSQLVFDGTSLLQVKSLTQVTSTFGKVVVRYVTAPAAGQFALSASITSTVKASYQVTTSVPSGGYALRVAGIDAAGVNGIFGTSVRTPVTAQLLRFVSQGPTWKPIKGDEPEFQSVAVRMEVRNGAGEVVAKGEAVPAALGTGINATLDDAVTAVFWPKYLVQGPDAGISAPQLVQFTGEVMEVDAGSKSCCTEEFVIAAMSGTPSVEILRELPGGVAVAADACGTASTLDQALGFRVENPASYPIYARITERAEVNGEALVALPAKDAFPRHPDDDTLLSLPGGRRTTISLGMMAGSHGGKVSISVFAADPHIGPDHLTEVAQATAQVQPGGDSLSAGGKPLVAKVILPVRNFDSTENPPPGQAAPPTSTEPPLLIPANLVLCVGQSGRLSITSGGKLVGEGDVVVDAQGAHVTPVASSQVPEPKRTANGALSIDIPPGDPAGQRVAVSLAPLVSSSPATSKELTLKTVVRDTGALPVGHLFVKDVSVSGGHIAKQFEDLRISGRGPAVAFARSYSSQGLEASPLGMGWSHSFRSFVLENATPAGASRYLVVGGEGTGQVFTCGPDQTGCTAQRGYHGTFRGESVQVGQGSERRLVFRSKGGVEYRYGAFTSAREARYRLLSIKDPAGNTVELEYAGASADEEVARVYEAGGTRFLQFLYERPPGVEHPRLLSVELRKNTQAPTKLPADEEGQSLHLCIGFAYDAHDNLTSAKRYDGPCDPAAPALRSESYEYVQTSSWDEAAWNNLAAYVDPNGVRTEYVYYGPQDVLPGETSFSKFGDKKERVKAVNEPQQAVTSFTYGLDAHLIGGTSVPSFVTTVAGPRPNVPPTTYYLEGYGSGVRVARPLGRAGAPAAPAVAVTDTTWDSRHQRPTSERDARGRLTTYAYDVLGNLVERRVSTSALPGTSGANPAAAAADGGLLSDVVERWGYEPAFGQLVCHIDAEGYVTTYRVDSNGANPSVADGGTPAGTGLRLESRRFATRLPSLGQPGARCEDLATGVATSANDVIQRFRYCGVDGVTCSAAGAKTGDLSAVVDGEDNTTSNLAFDALGNPTQTKTESPKAVPLGSSATLLTYAAFDDRGRLKQQIDSAGHHLEKEYDGLDRPHRISRVNTKAAGSATPHGLEQTFEYFPGGQVKSETSGQGSIFLTRTTTLDGRGRPATVTESGSGLSPALTTTYGYDEAGNKTEVTDRRGVTTRTELDFSDRPVEVSVEVKAADATRFSAQSGEGPTGRKAIASYGYDEVGNKLFETDLHGHRTNYVLDSLYRVVQVKHPSVPGATPAATPEEYEVVRRYDRRGNKVYEQDGNKFVSTWEYDFAGRVVVATDPLLRTETRGYDRNGNLKLEEKASGGVTHLTRSIGPYDALKRPLAVTEKVTGLGGVRTTLSGKTVYDDVNHTVATRDFRGFVTLRRLDDLDRVFEQVVDSQSTNPPRTPDVVLAPPLQSAALELKTLFEYDAAGNRSATVDPLLRRTLEAYDGLGRVTARSLPMGVTESFIYDGEGRVISETDRRGVVRKHTFDVLGRPKSDVLVESISASGQELPTRSIDYADTPNSATSLTKVAETDADGHTTTRRADALHRELQTEDALGRNAYSWFDAVNRRGTRDPKGYKTEYDYDAVGRVLAQRDYEVGASTETYSLSNTYDDSMRKVTSKDRRFASTGTTFVKELDGLGRVVQTTRGAQKETTEYDGNGNTKLVTDANLQQAKSVFDGANRLVEQTRGLVATEATKPSSPATTTFKYDAAGNRLESKSLRATGVAYDSRDSYDELNRPVRTEDANHDVTFRAFDKAGNLLCEKRPRGLPPFGHGPVSGRTVVQLQSDICTPGYLTSFTYDEEGKLLSVSDAKGGLTSYVYDQARNLVARQDALRHLTTYGYDELHRRIAEHQHLSEQAVRFDRGSAGTLPGRAAPDPAFTSGALSWERGYDENGNALWTTDPKGQRADYLYGLLDRLASVTYSGQAVPRPALALNSETYSYDENGNLTSVQLSKLGAAIEYTTRTFDVLDRLETDTRYDGKVTRYEYDKKGNRTRVTDSENVATVYTFDAQDRLKTAMLPAGTASYEYWEDSLPKAITLPNGVVEKKCYDAGGRLVAQVTSKGAVSDTCQPTGPALSRYDYTYDADGNRLTQVEQRTDVATQGLGLGENTQYGYDELDRLVGVKYPDGTAHLYQLDEVGNRTGERRGPSSLVSALTVAAFLAMPPAQATHDIQSVFNGADWLVSQTDSRDASRNVALEYDANGNLTSKVKAASVRSFQWDVRDTLTSIQDDGLEVGRYDYDRSLQRTKRTTASENVEYVLDDKFVLLEADGSQASHPATRRYHYAVNALAVTDGTTTSFLSVDGQGSVTDATSTSGSLTSARQYDAWGRYRNNSAPIPTEPKLGYTGHQYDSETGLIYARARYYDPELGRFLSRDTVEGSLNDAPSLNRYSYVKANPLRYTDPSGNVNRGADEGTDYAYTDATRTMATKEFSQAVIAQKGGYVPYRLGVEMLQELSEGAGDRVGRGVEYVTGSSVLSANAATWTEFGLSLPVGVIGAGTIPESLYNAKENVNQSLIKYQAADERGDTGGKWRAGSQVLRTSSGVVLVVAGTARSFGIGRPKSGVVVESPVAPEIPVPEQSVSGGRPVGAGEVASQEFGVGPDPYSAEAAANRTPLQGPGAAAASGGKFASGKPPHAAEVIVERNGEVVSRESIRSGGMTPEEAALGFPKSSLATHTEARAVRSTPLEAGDEMTIKGKYPPCPSCKGEMNAKARVSGATIKYEWDGKTWKAK